MENIKIEKKEDSVLVRINTKIYPLPIIYQAADVFIDKNYVFLEGDPEKEVLVTLKPKDKNKDLEKVAGNFNNELLNYSAYFVRAATNRDMRELILKKAFFSVTGEKPKDEEFEEKLAEKEKIDIGTKVPIYGEGSSEDMEAEENNLETKEEAREGEKKETEKTEKPQTEETDDEGDLDLEEITKPWEEQKGKIDGFSGELEEENKKE